MVKYQAPLSDEIPDDRNMTDNSTKTFCNFSNTEVDGERQNLENLTSVVVDNNLSTHKKDKHQENTLKRKMIADESFNADSVVNKHLKTDEIMHPCEKINNGTIKGGKGEYMIFNEGFTNFYLVFQKSLPCS